jgi:formate hydrogenlyase transcriptional activator
MTGTGMETTGTDTPAVVPSKASHTSLWDVGRQRLPFIPGFGTHPSGDGADGDPAEIKEPVPTEAPSSEDEIRFDQNVGGMIGKSVAFKEVLRTIGLVAPTDATVLVHGETGTGKELVARAIHDLSGRSKQPFIKVNCAAIPGTLLESELFGHERGSFTGAFAQKIGRFEAAHKGTIFLDEIGEIPLELQAKLLRAMQERELERLGGNRTIKLDIRIVAATNRNLQQMAEEGKFRRDLYYRLNVFPLAVPSLRERGDDIPLLVRYFTRKYAVQMNRDIDEIPSASIESLMAYDWPGNIRELQNIIERSVILSFGRALQVVVPARAKAVPQQASSVPAFSEIEREQILRALTDSGGQVGGARGAAAILGLPRTTLQARMKRLEIKREYAWRGVIFSPGPAIQS